MSDQSDQKVYFTSRGNKFLEVFSGGWHDRSCVELAEPNMYICWNQRVLGVSSHPLQHLVSINQGLPGGPCSHGGHRNAFQSHAGRGRRNTGDAICQRSLLLSFDPPFISSLLLPDFFFLQVPWLLSVPLLICDNTYGGKNRRQNVFQMTLSSAGRLSVLWFPSLSVYVLPCHGSQREVYLYPSSASVTEHSAPMSLVGASSLFHPFVINFRLHVAVDPPVCFSQTWPTFERCLHENTSVTAVDLAPAPVTTLLKLEKALSGNICPGILLDHLKNILIFSCS